MDELETLPQRLKALRQAWGLTQAEMAKAMGITLRSLQEYEAGRRRPPPKALLGLARQGINLHWLLTGDGPQHVLPSALDPDLLEAIIAALEDLPEGKALPPERKARLIAAVYDLYSASGQRPDKDKITRLLGSL